MHYIDASSLEQICSLQQIFDYSTKLTASNGVCNIVLYQIISMDKKEPRKQFETAQILLDFVWERLNTGHWSSVDDSWRKMYAVLSLIKVYSIVTILRKCSYSPEKEAAVIQDLIKMCDIGLLMGAPILNGACANLASYFCQCLPSGNSPMKSDNAKKRKVDPPLLGGSGLKLVEEFDELSMEEFIAHKSSESPVKITNCLNHWPALEEDGRHKWCTDYFSKVMGYRTVPIELGKRYTDDSWTQTLSTVNDFIGKCLDYPEFQGYLAQHELFNQVPELKEDFDIPLYCYSGENVADDNDVAINIWFGPSGTISPLHTDPKHNCLCQVFGQKYVRLYTSNQTDFLYPFNSESLLSNTSQINMEEEHEEITKKYPEFRKARGFECILNPGDILYIPPKCWHFVKSLSTSCSLSFWFE